MGCLYMEVRGGRTRQVGTEGCKGDCLQYAIRISLPQQRTGTHGRGGTSPVHKTSCSALHAVFFGFWRQRNKDGGGLRDRRHVFCREGGREYRREYGRREYRREGWSTGGNCAHRHFDAPRVWSCVIHPSPWVMRDSSMALARRTPAIIGADWSKTGLEAKSVTRDLINF